LDPERYEKMEAIKTGQKNVAETVVAQGSFKTLDKALRAAGLTDTLKGKGPFTVFAPSDEAFAKVPKGTLDDLMKPENKTKLAGILNYHVVSGTKKAADLAQLTDIRTVQGTDLHIASEGGKVRVGEGRVTKADIECSNGVIHMIDTVAMPK
jgi:uncharacterized surface protein with fasciclin (FAS1) repeats